jgi:hypothetical protein
MKAKERAKMIERALLLTWSSLESHLRFTHEVVDPKDTNETNAFHKKCVREYSEIISILTKLY